jgi:hypothetical protein
MGNEQGAPGGATPTGNARRLARLENCSRRGWICEEQTQKPGFQHRVQVLLDQKLTTDSVRLRLWK